jgi:NAD-dependent dihydropyrimidine dehydrogenase PreA subunit
MGIRKIDYELCTGCGLCVEECPMDVLRMEKNLDKPFIKYLRDCQACFLCEADCPVGAIYVTPDRERRIPSPF